jgi:hypothetical protein
VCCVKEWEFDVGLVLERAGWDGRRDATFEAERIECWFDR